MQNIIVLTIVFLAAGYTIWSIVKTLRIKSSGSCSDACGCSAKSDIKKALQKRQKEVQLEKLKLLRS